MNITIYSVCWNEEIILPYFFKHYRSKFPDANFIIYDNMSSDNSRKIIEENGGTIVDYDTDGKVRDDKLLEIKNNCWKTAPSDWVIVCDIDEFVDVDQNLLQKTKATIITTEGYEMVGNSFDLEKLEKGTRNDFLDKSLVFNKKIIKEINFTNGCHTCNPKGTVVFNTTRVVLRHMKYFHKQYPVNRFKTYAERLSKENLENGWSLHYLQKEEEINNAYNFLNKNAGKVPYPFVLHFLEKQLNRHRWVDKLIASLKILPEAVRRQH